jgi:hypothetical protein
MIMNSFTNTLRGYIQRAVKHFITSRFEEVPFVIFASYLFTFLFTRTYVYLSRTGKFDFLVENIYINGVHIHHLNFGIIILVLVGFWALYDVDRATHRTLAIFYGVGLALTFDEFALWLHLEDNYYAQISYNAILFISLVLLNIIYFPQFWRKMGKTIFRFFRPLLKLFKPRK